MQQQFSPAGGNMYTNYYQEPNFQQNAAPTPAYGYGAPGNHGGALPVRLPTKDWNAENPLCATIITVNNNGSSFDPLFTQVKQEPPEENVSISLWQLSYGHLRHLLAALAHEEEVDETYQEIVKDIERAEPESVLLNFECCGACSDKGFSHPTEVFGLLDSFLKHKHNVAFGDFSTKALIHAWDEKVLGKNPLVRCGELSASFDLRFDAAALRACPNAQLSTVGELCAETGSAHVGAMGGTCMFSVDFAKVDEEAYTFQVLTVMTHQDNAEVTTSKTCSVEVGGTTYSGAAGHVSFQYPSGGNLFISAGHWIELVKLDTTVEIVHAKILAEKGAEEAANFMNQYNASPAYAQEAQVQSYAKLMVQTSAPVQYGNISKGKKF